MYSESIKRIVSATSHSVKRVIHSQALSDIQNVSQVPVLVAVLIVVSVAVAAGPMSAASGNVVHGQGWNAVPVLAPVLDATETVTPFEHTHSSPLDGGPSGAFASPPATGWLTQASVPLAALVVVAVGAVPVLVLTGDSMTSANPIVCENCLGQEGDSLS